MLNFFVTALSQLTTDVSLSGTAQGDIFYRGASKWNNLAAGTAGYVLKTGGASANPSWVDVNTLVTPTSPGGSSGQVQYNSSGSFGGAAALVYSTSGSNLAITGINNSDIPLQIIGHSSSLTGSLIDLLSNNSSTNARAEIAFHSKVGDRKRTIGVTQDDLQILFGANGTDYFGLQVNVGPGSIFNATGIFSTNGFGFQCRDSGTVQFGGTSTANTYYIEFGVRPDAGTSDPPASGAGTITRGTAINLYGASFGNQLSSALTTTVGTYWRYRHYSSGTPATGFGGMLQFALNSSTTADRVASDITTAWATATDASRKGRLILNVYDTSARESLRAESDGSYGLVSIGGAIAATTQFQVVSPTATYVAGVFKAASSQSADLLDLQNSSGVVVSGFDSAGNGFVRSATFALALGTTATTGTNKTNVLIVPYAGKIVKAWAVAKTGPTGADLICDINLNGTSIWASTQANRIKIVAGATTGSQTSFDTTTVAAGDQLTIDIDQVGSTVAGQDITIQLTILTVNR